MVRRIVNRLLASAQRVGRWPRPHVSSIGVGIAGGLAFFLGFNLTQIGGWLGRETNSCSGVQCPQKQWGQPERDLLKIIAAQRNRAGCQPIRHDDRLTAAARLQATEIAASAGVDRTRTPSQWQLRAKAAGYPAEVTVSVAIGVPTADQVAKYWLNPSTSAELKQRLWNCQWRSLGIGYVADQPSPQYGAGVWVVFFGDV